ncbi:MAG: nitrogenase cofactor biosynthesis protein NifB [Bacillota bacterium]
MNGDSLGQTDKHPCYSFSSMHKHARMHLPVAPNCNISCNYCNRRYDCQNESRPGVTSEILTPFLALQKFKMVKKRIENLSVVGIAGPGDALANWTKTKTTIKLIKETAAELIFCMSTNGLMLPEYAGEIIDLGIRHVTVTVNCLDPNIGKGIYKYVHYMGKAYSGVTGAKLLIENQQAGIEYMARNGAVIKVNIVMIKGVNDGQIPKIVKRVKELGAFITNIMPLVPAQGSAFENYPQPTMKELTLMRNLCEADLQQMHHCKQCRADAIGLLSDDRTREFCFAYGNREAPVVKDGKSKKQYKIAVASKYGKLIDQHFGHATEFAVYLGDGEIFELVEKRRVQQYCLGVEDCDPEANRRERIIETLKDCDAVLSMRIGYHARKRLQERGILSFESCDTVESGLSCAVKKLHERDIA